MQPLEFGAQKQLFIDDLVIDEAVGVTRNLNQPAKYVGNPVMIPIYPWEGRLELFGTVWRDPDGSFRMWYQGMGGMGVADMGLDLSGTPLADLDFDMRNLQYSICYATSHDGIHWERPNLGLVEFNGATDNNIVIANAAFANVIEDPRDPDPNRRYKSLFFEDPDWQALGSLHIDQGVSVAFSPDGLRWTKHPGNPVITRSSDSHTLFGWDESHGCYVAYARPTMREGNMTRRIGRCVSGDFVNWSDPEDVLAPDEHDPPAVEFYGMPVFRYEGHYLGLLYVFHTRPEEPIQRNFRNFGPIDVQLASSRDGVNWDRAGDREPFIPNGPPGSDDAGEIFVARAPVVVDDELWFYYSPSAVEHGVTGRSGPICLAKLRKDGFVSVDAGDDTGTLVTRPFRCDGGLLTINAAARGGLVGVAVLDESGTQHRGYSLHECALFDGDSVRQRITWKEKRSLDELQGRNIRLKFYLRNAKLYAFTVGRE